jgi:hypothetical protein
MMPPTILAIGSRFLELLSSGAPVLVGVPKFAAEVGKEELVVVDTKAGTPQEISDMIQWTGSGRTGTPSCRG